MGTGLRMSGMLRADVADAFTSAMPSGGMTAQVGESVESGIR